MAPPYQPRARQPTQWRLAYRANIAWSRDDLALPSPFRERHPNLFAVKMDRPPGTPTPSVPMEFTSKRYDFRNKDADYASLADELNGLLAGEPDLIANAANTAALLFDALPDINWAGFYFLGKSAAGESELVVGPFQGKPACVRIPLGKGVCGTAAATRKTIVVTDVHAFPGHIACDAASQSEIVVPLLKGDTLLGVLDIDSPGLARFDDADRRGLERLAAIFVTASRAPAVQEPDARRQAS